MIFIVFRLFFYRYVLINILIFSILLFGLTNCNNPNPIKGTKDSTGFKWKDSGAIAYNNGNYPEAIQCQQKAIEIFQKTESKKTILETKIELACSYSRVKSIKEGIRLVEDVLRNSISIKDTNLIEICYATLSGFFGEDGDFEKSKYYGFLALNLIRHTNNAERRSAVYNQYAYTFLDAGDFNSAIKYFDTARLILYQSTYKQYIPSISINLGHCKYYSNRKKEALKDFNDAFDLADSMNQAQIAAKALQWIGVIQFENADYKNAYINTQKASNLRDSILSKENLNKIAELETKYKTKEKFDEILILKSENQTRKILIILIILVFVILSLFTIMYFKRKNARLISIETELQNKKIELQNYLQILIDKNGLISQLETKIQTLEIQDSQLKKEEDFEQDNFEFNMQSRILTQEDWEVFKYKFEAANPGFIQRLRNEFPSITPGEERHFLLIKSNLNSQEIASVLGIGALSVKKSRQRLRKRLNLEIDTELELYIKNMKI